MPISGTEGRRARSAAEVQSLIEALYLANDVTIVLHEVALDNLGIRGGNPASEVDLGFEVDV